MATTQVTRFVSVSEAAVRLRVSAATIRRWIHAGHLAAVQPAGEQGLLRIPEAELDRLAGDRYV
jgi:excisionase family DNA binding protein